jgi:hypothetical protein
MHKFSKPKIAPAMKQEMPKKIGKIKSDNPKPTISNGMKWAADKKPSHAKTDRGNFGFK